MDREEDQTPIEGQGIAEPMGGPTRPHRSSRRHLPSIGTKTPRTRWAPTSAPARPLRRSTSRHPRQPAIAPGAVFT